MNPARSYPHLKIRNISINIHSLSNLIRIRNLRTFQLEKKKKRKFHHTHLKQSIRAACSPGCVVGASCLSPVVEMGRCRRVGGREHRRPSACDGHCSSLGRGLRCRPCRHWLEIPKLSARQSSQWPSLHVVAASPSRASRRDTVRQVHVVLVPSAARPCRHSPLRSPKKSRATSDRGRWG